MTYLFTCHAVGTYLKLLELFAQEPTFAKPLTATY